MEKRKAGQPKKDNPKIRVTFRLDQEVIKQVKKQPNQSKYIERLIMEDILNDLGIEHQITESGELICLVKMSTFADDDCSEWLSAYDVIKQL